jgi:glucan phosphoethanolaminetransferase (alkaline phosphatase superfamily)
MVPLLLCTADILIRWELLNRYSDNQMFFYISSLLISIGYFSFILLLLKSLEGKPIIYFSISILVFPLLLFSFFGSYTFFSLNGIFPNYYTFLYFKTEPKSAMMIIRDVSGWKELIGILVGILVLIASVRWYTKKHVTRIQKKWLIIFGIVQFSAFETLISFHKKYDQCAIVDANFAACIQRHAFTWDDHSEFKGKGLEERTTPKIELKKNPKKFNVVVFIFESVRKRSLQIYGNKNETTPNFAEMQKKFPENFYVFKQPVSVSSTTMLAVPAILTGIGPYQDKSILYSQPLIWEYANIFDYKTFFLSSHTLKWYKFDEFYKKEKLDVWWNKDNSGLPYFNDLGIKDELTIKKLNRTISNFSNKPFFGVVQLNTTHYPYEVPEKYKKWNHSFGGSYDNAVRYQDAIIGDFFKHLKQEGLLENTIVLFASDHGESLAEHHNIGHVESNYTETISIPLLAYIPDGVISSDEKNELKKNRNQLTSNIDIAPTIVDLLNLENEPKLQRYMSNYTGFSLLKPIPDDRMLISLNNNQVASFNTGLSVCSKNWHYLFRTNLVPNKEEFYYWKKDVKELKDQQKYLSKKQRNTILGFVKRYPVCDKLRKKVEKYRY